ncbi:hypothetical protein [Myxococcus qinghaiensis]|nr:hypothetical protein [Myxococcus qinghaiensis]
MRVELALGWRVTLVSQGRSTPREETEARQVEQLAWMEQPLCPE